MLPVTMVLLFFLCANVHSYDPVRLCSNCKYFIPHNRNIEELGLCKMFQNISYDKKTEAEIKIPNYAFHNRNNENLCGKAGFLYESKELDTPNSEINDNNDKNIISNKLNELNNRCCGEVNETDEIEQLEREFFEVFQKIKKHNKKQIYRTTKDLYKLFKK
jgi:hypothetical protein